MLTEVFCPKCQAKLRSPSDLTGKTVRCAKCQERFRASSSVAPPTASVGDTQMLSVMEMPAPKPAAKPTRSALDALDDVPVPEAKPAVKIAAKPVAVASKAPAPAGAFAFDDAPPEKAKAKKKPSAAEEEIETVVDTANGPAGAGAFSFDDAPEPPKKKRSKRDDDADDDTPEPPKKKRSKRDDDEEDDEPSEEKKKVPKILLLMGCGVLMFLFLGGGGAGYWFLVKKPEMAKAKASATIVAAPAENKPTKPDAKSTATDPTTAKSTSTDNGGKPKPIPKGGPKPPPGPGKSSLPKAPAADAALASPANAKEKFTVDAAPEIKAFRVAGDATDRRVFIARNTSLGFMGQGAKDTIERYAADTGAKTGSCEISTDGAKWPRPIEASPDGKLVIVEGPAGKLNLYSFEESKFLLEGEDPFKGLANRKAPIRGLVWKGNDRFVVFDNGGNPDEWSVADKKPASKGVKDFSEPEPDTKILAAALDSKGEYIAIVRGSEYHVLEKGKLKGPGALPESNAVPIAVTGSALADKVKLAVVAKIKDTEQHVVFVIPLAEPTKHTVIPLPDGLGDVSGIAWQSINTLIVNIEKGEAALLVDLEEAAAVGYVKSPSGKAQVFGKAPFNSLWYAIPNGAGKAQITSVNLDFDAYKPMAENAKSNKMPAFIVPKDTGIEK